MKWVRIDDVLPKEDVRVLVALRIGAVKLITAVGALSKGKWYVDEVARPLEPYSVYCWAPIAPLPYEDTPIDMKKVTANLEEYSEKKGGRSWENVNTCCERADRMALKKQQEK